MDILGVGEVFNGSVVMGGFCAEEVVSNAVLGDGFDGECNGLIGVVSCQRYGRVASEIFVPFVLALLIGGLDG